MKIKARYFLLEFFGIVLEGIQGLIKNTKQVCSSYLSMTASLNGPEATYVPADRPPATAIWNHFYATQLLLLFFILYKWLLIQTMSHDLLS